MGLGGTGAGEADWAAESWVGGLVDLWVNIWLPSPPTPQVRHYYFCKLEQHIFSRFQESAPCIGTVKHRV